MTQIRTPSERTCTLCGRSERWDDDAAHWRVDEDAGEVFCVHAWDVTGTFTTVEQ